MTGQPPTPTPVPTIVSSGQAPKVALVGSNTSLTLIIILMIGVATILVLTPIVLRISNGDLFRIPYVTWFLLRYVTAGVAILVIGILGLTGILSAEVIATLYGSLLGYVLGSRPHTQSENGQTGPTPQGQASDTTPPQPSAAAPS